MSCGDAHSPGVALELVERGTTRWLRSAKHAPWLNFAGLQKCPSGSQSHDRAAFFVAARRFRGYCAALHAMNPLLAHRVSKFATALT